MYRKLGDTIYLDFTTHNPSTGAVSDADSLPTCEVFEDAEDTPILSPTVVKRTGKTGNYRVPVAATTGNGFEVGKSYNVVVSATVNSVAAKGVIGSFSLDGKRNADLNDLGGTAQTGDAFGRIGDAFGRIGDAGAGLTALGDTRIANLNATVSSRSTATQGATAGELAAAQAAIEGAVAALNDITAAQVLAGTVEGGLSLAAVLRIMLSALAGKLAGAATTEVTTRSLADTKPRITATVDADGNRTAVTLDGS